MASEEMERVRRRLPLRRSARRDERHSADCSGGENRSLLYRRLVSVVPGLPPTTWEEQRKLCFTTRQPTRLH